MRWKSDVELFPVNPAVAQPAEGDTVVDVKSQFGRLGEGYDVVGMDGLSALWLLTTKLTGESVSGAYCVGPGLVFIGLAYLTYLLLLGT